MPADGPEQRLAEILQDAEARAAQRDFAELMADDPLEETHDLDRAHLEALRKAGIPKALEADAMMSIRQARYVGKAFDAIFGARTWSEPPHCRHDRALGCCPECEMERRP